jgi:dCTP diphosphatase
MMMMNENSNDSYDNNKNATTTTTTLLGNPRSCILQVGVYAGRLCEIANTHPGMITYYDDRNNITNKNNEQHDRRLVSTLADLWNSLYETCQALQLNMIVSIYNKLELNAKKYPVEHCKGKAGKYTEYSHVTGITKTNQVTQDDGTLRQVVSIHEITSQIPDLALSIHEFATDRLWTKYHTPRNIVMALLGEVGELSELLQFKGDSQLEITNQELDKLSQEIADVSIYMLRLTTVCNVVQPLCDELRQRQQY